MVCLDKTGTLTTGTPTVHGVHAFGDWTADDVTKYAAAIEARSEHPLARAICAAPAGATPGTHDVNGFTSEAGNGVVGTLHATATTPGAVVVVGRPAYVRANAPRWDAAVEVAKRLGV